MEEFLSPLLVGKLAIAAFFTILFLQSGVDKILDWKGNLSWLKGHFSKTPLVGLVPLLLGIMTVAELATGILTGLGFVMLLINGSADFAIYGVMFALISFLMLFFGQRLAKDYEGAATIAIYFGVGVVSLIFLA